MAAPVFQRRWAEQDEHLFISFEQLAEVMQRIKYHVGLP
jgi:hypothetical protein